MSDTSNEFDAPLSETEMAKELFKQFRETVRWVPDLRGGAWVRFERRWRGEPEDHDWVIEQLDEAIAARARTMRLRVTQFNAMTSLKFIKPVIEKLTRMTRLQRRLKRWDEHPELLQTPDSVWDLETGTRRDTRVSDFHLKCTRFEPDASMSKPKFDGLRDTVWRHEPEDRTLMEDRLGGALFGRGDAKLTWLIGVTRSGKSTFMLVVAGVLGDYAGIRSASLLIDDRRTPMSAQQVRNHMATLVGLRLAVLDEAAENRGVLSSAAFKQLIGAKEAIVEPKHQQPRTEPLGVSVVLVTNRLPEGGIGGDDGASIYERLAVVCANGAGLIAGQRVTDLDLQIIEEEGPAVLAWAIEQAKEYYDRRGLFGPPPAMSQAANNAARDFTREGTPLVDWIEERVEIDPSQNTWQVGAADLWDDFDRWWSAQPLARGAQHLHAPLTPANFYLELAAKLKAYGCQTYAGQQNGKRFRGYVGAKLR